MASPFVYVCILLLCHFITSIMCHSLFAVTTEGKLNWTEANIACNNSIPRGQLASSHNASHDRNTNTICSSTTSDECWIGFYTQNNDWQWIDNTPTNYYQFTDTNPPQTVSQLCVSLVADDNSPLWTKTNCSNKLSGAVCSQCGELNEVCCGIGNECNGQNLECVNNICVQAIETTEMYTTSSTASVTWYKEGKFDAWHSQWSIEMSIIIVFFICVCTGVGTYLSRKSKERIMTRVSSKHNDIELNTKQTLEREFYDI